MQIQLPTLGAVEHESVRNENCHRKILHAKPPLNPLHRVEVIFARIFLVFRPSSRIGVQGSCSPSLSSALACFLSQFSISLAIVTTLSPFLSLSLVVRLSIHLRFSLSTVLHIATASFAVARSRAASERGERTRIAASACIAVAHENLETIRRTVSNSSRLFLRFLATSKSLPFADNFNPHPEKDARQFVAFASSPFRIL